MSHYKNAIHAAVKALEAKHGKIGFSIRVYDYSKYILNIHSLSVDVMENALEHSAAVMERLDRARDCKAYERAYHISNEVKRFNEDRSDAYSSVRFSECNPEMELSGKALEIVKDLYEALKCEYENNSDVMRDYFDISYYYELNFGSGKRGFSVK